MASRTAPGATLATELGTMARAMRRRAAAGRLGRPAGGPSLVLSARPVAMGAIMLAVFLTGSVILDYNPLSPLTQFGLKAIAAALTTAVAAFWIRGPNRTLAADVTAGAAGSFAALVVAAGLHGTPFPAGGLGLGAALRTPAVVRFAADWRNADFTYEGLPAFYPPLLPWVTGRAAAVLDLAPYHALKLASIAAAFFVPLVTYLLWRRLVTPAVAALISLATLAVPNFIQSDSWLALFVIVPWWLEAVYGIRRDGCRARPVFVQGLIGALIFCLYYYFYFILTLGLLLAFVLDRLHPPAEARIWLRRMAVLGVAALLSSVYWLPLLVSIAEAPHPASLQNFWFNKAHLRFPLNFLQPSVPGVVMLVGLVHTVWTAARDRLSAGLALLVSAGYTWYVAGFVLAAVGAPVLVFRAEPFLDLVLIASGIRALAAAARHASARWPQPDVFRVAAAASIAVSLFVAHGYITELMTAPYLAAAHNEALPEGGTPRYATRRAVKVPANLIIETIRELYTGEGEPVVLSTRPDVVRLSTMPAFNQGRAIYAHPAGEFRARLAFMRELAAAQDAEQFTFLADHNRFDPIDAVVLRPGRTYLRYTLYDVRYPRANVRDVIKFDRSLFDDSLWKVRELTSGQQAREGSGGDRTRIFVAVRR